MASYKTAFGSFLKQEDLQGREVRVVIESVAIEELKTDDGKEKKLVAHFVGKDKGLVLNRTTCETLEAITGTDDYDHWVDTPVVLFVDPTVKFGPKTVGGIRIKSTARPAPVAVPREDVEVVTDDAIPF
jgi:hypothetical protein